MGLTPEPGPADVVRRQYLASAAGDLAALRATLAPDVEWTEMAGFPLAGTYSTPEGVTTNVMENLASVWDDWTAHDDTYVVEGEKLKPVTITLGISDGSATEILRGDLKEGQEVVTGTAGKQGGGAGSGGSPRLRL